MKKRETKQQPTTAERTVPYTAPSKDGRSQRVKHRVEAPKKEEEETKEFESKLEEYEKLGGYLRNAMAPVIDCFLDKIQDPEMIRIMVSTTLVQLAYDWISITNSNYTPDDVAKKLYRIADAIAISKGIKNEA